LTVRRSARSAGRILAQSVFFQDRHSIIMAGFVTRSSFRSDFLNVLRKGSFMSKKLLPLAAVTLAAGVAYAQFPIMDRVADKVIQKYQTASCEQLWQERAQGKGQPKPEMEQRAIEALRNDPQMRQAFFNKVSAPIVNKMFECGMIP